MDLGGLGLHAIREVSLAGFLSSMIAYCQSAISKESNAGERILTAVDGEHLMSFLMSLEATNVTKPDHSRREFVEWATPKSTGITAKKVPCRNGLQMQWSSSAWTG